VAALEGLARPLPPPGGRRMQQVILRLEALPAFYPAVHKALRLIEDPLSNNSHIQQVISTDQAAAGRILQLANCAYFGFRSEVRTVSLAISLLGREKVATLLLRFLSEELITMLCGHKPEAGRIRRMSVNTAAAAHLMARRLLRADREEILLAGLLHNIGDLVLLSQFRHSYEEMMRLAGQMPQDQAEAAVFGAAARQVGKWLLEAWNFPPFFPAVIEHYPDPLGAPFQAAPAAAIAIVHMARKLAEAGTKGHDADAPAQAKQAASFSRSFPPRLLRILEIDPPFLADVYMQIPGEISARWAAGA
jgi:HD-like signal output (HDOD) protein